MRFHFPSLLIVPLLPLFVNRILLRSKIFGDESKIGPSNLAILKKVPLLPAAKPEKMRYRCQKVPGFPGEARSPSGPGGAPPPSFSPAKTAFRRGAPDAFFRPPPRAVPVRAVPAEPEGPYAPSIGYFLPPCAILEKIKTKEAFP